MRKSEYILYERDGHAAPISALTQAIAVWI